MHIKSFLDFLNESQIDENIELIDKYGSELKEIKKFIFDTIDSCKDGRIDYESIPEQPGKLTLFCENPESIFMHKLFTLGKTKILIAFEKCEYRTPDGTCFEKFVNPDTGNLERETDGSVILLRYGKSKSMLWKVAMHELNHALDYSRNKTKGLKVTNFQGEIMTLTDYVRDTPFGDIAEIDKEMFDKLLDAEPDEKFKKAMLRARGKKSAYKTLGREQLDLIERSKMIIAVSLYYIFDNMERSSHIIDGSLSVSGNKDVIKKLDTFYDFIDSIEELILNDWDDAEKRPDKKEIIDFIVDNINKMKLKEGARDKTDKGKVKFYVTRGKHLINVMKKKIEKNYNKYKLNKGKVFKPTK